jgi:CRP/FNR family transcriptional regulator, cyclic AMP receptor protein
VSGIHPSSTRAEREPGAGTEPKPNGEMLVDLTQASRDVGLFGQLMDDVRAGQVRARRRTFAKGEVVFHEDDPGDSLHLIEAGLFAVRTSTSSGQSLIINVLTSGDVFGEFAVFSPEGRRTTEVDALVAGGTYSIRRDEIGRVLQARPELIEDLMGAVVAKADSTRRRLVELLSVPADLRVIRAVLLVDALDPTTDVVPLTQSDLASLAATTRPTANHILREEAERGTLRLARGRITVLDANKLARRAGVELPMR